MVIVDRKDAGRGLSGEIKGCSSVLASNFHILNDDWSKAVSELSLFLPRVEVPLRPIAFNSQSSNEEM